MSSVIFLLIQVILHSVHLTATQQYIGVHFASEGDDVIIRCVISDVSFDGNKFYKVLWLWTPQNSDGKQEILNILKSNGKHTKTSISVNRQRLSDKVTLWAKDKVDYGIFSLVISQVQAEASGNYTCHVKTKNFTHDYITKLFITDGRKELKADFRQIQELGDVNVVLSCKPQRNLCTSHGVSWFFTPLDGKGIKKVIERYQSESGRTYRHWSIKDSFSIQNFKKGDFSLNITSIRREDLGIYKCFVYSRNVHVEITVEMLIQNGISTTIQTKPTEYPNASRGEKTNLLIPILAGTTSTLLIIGIVTLCWCKSSIKGPKRKRLANTSATVAVKMTNVEGRQQHENPLYVSDSVYANNKTRSSGQIRNDAKAKQAQIQVHRNQGDGAGPMGCAGDAEYQDCIYACVSTKLPNSFRCSTKTISELPKYQENLMEDASDELVYAEIDYKMTNDHNASNETSFCA